MIDWNRINELRDEIGPEDFAEVAEMFVSEVDSSIDSLRTSANMTTLAEDLHFLKGSALNLGFADLSTLCQNGEAVARSGNPEDVDLTEIVTVYEKSREEFLNSALVKGAA
ncbi:Hpt domain-containing protein [Donghicola sp. XS_ASV15]|uniref:Hpt domain-containing protein n=1 Tax=Donghicola sp. XS_ASV15 TaxID=3241295 RepID=UPI003511C9BC